MQQFSPKNTLNTYKLRPTTPPSPKKNSILFSTEQFGKWTTINTKYESFKVFIPNGMSINQTITSIYPTIYQVLLADAAEDLIDEQASCYDDEEEAIEAAWDNYERWCYMCD